MKQTTEQLAGVTITISTPTGTAKGVTFLLPGSMIAIGEYNQTRDVLVKNDQVVLSFFLNVLTTKHRVFAQRVKDVFDAFVERCNFEKYNIVGHSIGAKVALLVAAVVDVDRVEFVVALDPIDMNPPEFTSGNAKLANAKAALHITWATAGGFGITVSNNPHAVYETDPKAVKSFTKFDDAGHMAYTDHGGGLPGLLMPGGTKAGSKMAHARTLDLVKKLIL